MKIADLASPATAAQAAEVRNTYVLPRQKIVFTSIGKNACTSIKWLLAEISGQDVESFRSHPSAEPSRRMLIHNRKLWQNTPRLSDLDAGTLGTISPSNGWFVFGVVRDPRLRLFSAWQSKFLVGDPIYFHRKWAGRDWLPRTPTSPEEVLADWARFVDVLTAGRGGGGPAGDGHFAPQTSRLREDLVPYSRVYEISEIGQLTGDLTDHLATVGQHVGELTLARENDTPLAAGREVFPDEIRQKIERHYAADFDRFGALWSLEKVMSRPISWTEQSMNDIAARRAVHERIADLREMVREANRNAIALERELLAARRRGPEPAADVRRPPQAVPTPLAHYRGNDLARELGRRGRRGLRRSWRRLQRRLPGMAGTSAREQRAAR